MLCQSDSPRQPVHASFLLFGVLHFKFLFIPVLCEGLVGDTAVPYLNGPDMFDLQNNER
jgi:hypothetical protein